MNSLDGVQYAISQQGELLSQGLQDISYAISQPRYTETRTNGRSWGGAQTTTHEVYEEHTISEGQRFTTGQNWETAWAVDSSHAADLTFTYSIKNTGTEYAREVSGLIFNIYLGDDTTPTISYPAWEQFPDGKLENLFPVGPNTPPGVGSERTFASTTIPLSLEQMKRIDLGERLTVKVESFSYGADELFYTDAVNGGVTVFVEDGVEDGNEAVDMYVIPTWGVESVQDVLTRYFPHDEDAGGNLNSLWTPEFDGINPPTWREHFLSDIAWWNVYLTQADASDTPLHQLAAQAGSGILFRFNRDSDRDGYNDRAEFRYYCALAEGDPERTPPDYPDRDYCDDGHLRPEIHPQPEVLAGYVTQQDGDVVTAMLVLENTGTFDAYGIDAVMISPDETTTIGNNTVGGNGQVRPGRSVAVGSIIQEPDTTDWGSSTSKPYAAGNYSGDADRTYTFSASTPGVVGQPGTTVTWNDGTGGSGTIDLGSSYHAPLPVDVSNGLQVGFNTGTMAAGASFTVGALTPRDTFTFTVESEPYTPPVIVVSYSDPQGSHRFVTPVELAGLDSSLAPHTGEMLKGLRLDIVATGTFSDTGANTTNLVVNNPQPTTIEGGHLHLNFVSDGTLVLEKSYTLDMPAGPTVFPTEWSISEFSADYNPDGDNILIAFWTDSENNIIDSAARPFSSFQEDPKPTFATDEAALTWNFGTVTKGEVLSHTIPLANIGFRDLLTHVSETVSVAEEPTHWVGFTNANYVNEIAMEGNYLWAATTGGVVARDLTDGTYLQFTTADSGLADNETDSVLVDADGYKWFGTISGVSVLDDGGTPLDEVDDTWVTFTAADGLGSSRAYNIVADTAGRKWFAVGGGGVSVLGDNGTPLDKSDDQWQTFTTTNLQCPSGTRSVTIDAAGRKWIGCGWDGVRVLDDGGTPFDKSDDQWQSFTKDDGMSGNLIMSIAIDGEGRKWIGSWSSPGGVSVLDDNGTPFDKSDDQWQTFFAADSGLVYDGVHSVVVDGDGYKWFGTGSHAGANGGVSVLDDNGTPFDKTDDTWATFTTGDGLSNNEVHHILVDGAGRKWFATFGGGVSVLDDKGTPFDQTGDQWDTFAITSGLAHNHVNTLIMDAVGRKWIGTYGGGANVLDDNSTPANKSDDQWITFTGTDGLPANIIYAIAIDGTGRKWFGGHGYRVSVLDDNGTPFDNSDDQWQTFTTSDGLAGITSEIVIDGSDRKWFGDIHRGVSVLGDNGTPFDKSDDQWQTFTTADGLANNKVGSIVVDGAGNKWFGTDGGVSVLNDSGTPFNKADDTWISFTTADGLVSNLVGDIVIDSNGYKWIGLWGTSGGLCVLDDNGTPFDKADDTKVCFTTADGLASDWITSNIVIDGAGHKWVGGGGVNVLDDNSTPFNKTDDTWTTYTAADGLTSNAVFAITLDMAGNKWFGTAGGVSVLLADQDGFAVNRVNVWGMDASSSTASKISHSSVRTGISETRTQRDQLPPADMALYTITVDTRALPTGPYTRTVDIRTSDPARPTATVQITGTIDASITQAFTAQASPGLADVTLSPTDISFDPASPTETDEVTVTATLHNTGAADAGPFTVAFFATQPAGFGETYIGAAFVPDVPAGSTADASIQWNTLGFAGDIPVRVVVDPFGRLAETDEDNNEAAANLTVLTRPDLQVPAIELSDPEPVAGQAVSVTLTVSNAGQTDAGASVFALYEGNPQDGGIEIEQSTTTVAGENEASVSFTWTPAEPGPHRLFAVSDRDDAVSEFDEGNNQRWRDVYVGLKGPISLNSGDDPDPAYTPALGYGAVDEGAADALAGCGSESHETFRRDPGNRVVYRFDHLLRGHFYHLDVTLYNCPTQPPRRETVLVDDIAVAGPVDLRDDGEVHRLSTLLDPAFYANRTISVTVQSEGSGAVVSEVNLHDIDYRYADAGGTDDLSYTPERGYGYLDETSTSQTDYGALPYQSYREDQADQDLHYQFDGLDPAKRYLIHLSFYQDSPFTASQQVFIDSVDTGLTLEVGPGQILTPTVQVPWGTYQSDGRIVVRVVRTTAGAFVNEIALEELTLGTPAEPGLETQTINLHAGWNWISFALQPKIERDPACTGVTQTAAFSIFKGDALIDGQPAPVGTLVEAYSPRGDKVGCEPVISAGTYPFLRVYGKEGSTPGMQRDEPIIFKVNGVPASVTSGTPIWQNDKSIHDVDLAASGLPPIEKVLADVMDVLEKLLCQVGTYLPLPANPVFNSCHTMQAGQGYLLRASGEDTLIVQGERVPADTPLDLDQGWNWIGYLPACGLPVETALATIDGQFDLLHDETGTFKPPAGNPDNTLHDMRPGAGYMIRMTEAATLKYPAAACGATQTFRVSETLKVFPTACEATPTPFFTSFYGTATLGDLPYPAGTPIQALSPRGKVVGCGQVGEDGRYPFLRVYGADEGIPGMAAGEPVQFRVNGRRVVLDAPPLWKNDRDVHRLDLRVEPERVLLPVVAR